MANDSNENRSEETEAPGEAESDGVDGGAPAQLGLQRFVFAAYFALAILVAFVVDKAVRVFWYRLSQWKPAIGEPRDEVSIGLAVVVAVGAAVWGWKQDDVRRLIEEVATELGQVTWPSKDDVGRSTAIVVGTTVLATVFFALMDALWRFLTNLVYGA
jgi:preprotein translocase subunit SecE